MVNANPLAFLGNIKLANQLQTELGKIVKKYPEERLFSALNDDEETIKFAHEVHSKLPIHIRNLAPADKIVPIIMAAKPKLLKSKSAKKKMSDAKKKFS